MAPKCSDFFYEAVQRSIRAHEKFQIDRRNIFDFDHDVLNRSCRNSYGPLIESEIDSTKYY